MIGQKNCCEIGRKSFALHELLLKRNIIKLLRIKKKRKERNIEKDKKKKEDLELLCLHDEKNIIGRYERVAAKASGLVKISINDVYPIVIQRDLL